MGKICENCDWKDGDFCPHMLDCKNYSEFTPKQKTGHWKAFIHSAYHGTDEDGEPIWREVTVYHCSQCNRRTVIKEKYCPNCGAKMDEEAADDRAENKNI